MDTNIPDCLSSKKEKKSGIVDPVHCSRAFCRNHVKA